MNTIQIRVDDNLKKDAYKVFDELNVNPSEAMRMLLQYVVINKKMPFSTIIVSDEDAELIAIAKERLNNPSKRIKVNIDDL